MTLAPPDRAPAAGLSTVPEPPGRDRAGGPGRALLRGWRRLTGMRTALLLLFLLALAAVPGSLLPQRGLNPVKVAQYFAAHPRLAPLLDRFTLFDVFSAPWFAAVYLLLFLSLTGCLVPRVRLHLAAMRARPPAAPRHFERLPAFAQSTAGTDPAAALTAAGAVLRRARWRVVARPGAGGEPALSAEKGYLRETGNLVFHLCLLVLLAGIGVGGLWGYKGTVLVKEGDGFANTVGAYDSFQPGRIFSPTRLAPFSFILDRFNATYQPNGQASTFDAAVTYRAAPAARPTGYDVRVNHPLDLGGTKTFLIGHGYAPRLVVRDGNGGVAFDGSVPCLPQDGQFSSSCTVKVPDAAPEQLGFSGYFFPTTVGDPARGLQSGYPAALAPGMTLLAYRGDLGLDAGVPQSVYALDTRHLTPVGTAFLRPGQTMGLPGGASLQFVGLGQWATLQVAHDPGKGTALLGAVGIVAGLALSLRIYRRRVWVRTSEAGTGRTVVEVGGLSRTDADRFTAEFAALTEHIKTAIEE